ncbi:hypothetical protein GE061_019776 [Apolygus lucorum]|uniref:Uncharacterized protein n=1 Tax=Apolygus lucorum TaxID=248454 RepID=A0A6A4JY21_APOLU|nr:hypothetical protein GE061_019776 [Apolygus lucorum]
MKLLVVCLLVGLLADESLSQGLIGGLVRRVANLIRYRNENRGQDGYDFAYETDDGTIREEKGGFVNGIWTVEGKSVWKDEQGVDHETKFVADDKGTKSETMEGRISQAALASLAG